MGGAMFAGPGGTQLYYKGLLDKLGVNAHVYKVGKFKSAVEPYIRGDMSPEAREAKLAMYGAIWASGRKRSPRRGPRRSSPIISPSPTMWWSRRRATSPRRTWRRARRQAGDRMAFGKRVAEIVGAPATSRSAISTRSSWTTIVEANPAADRRRRDRRDHRRRRDRRRQGGAGHRGRRHVSALLLKGLAKKKLKALVVRVDSPGGSALASEQIRQAILQAKAQGLPVVVSMGSLAASGGYWVSTVGRHDLRRAQHDHRIDRHLRVIPTFEKTLAKIGVGTDGVKTTPLSGQPDVYGGTNAETDRILQSAIEAGYAVSSAWSRPRAS
jgi:protease-4